MGLTAAYNRMIKMMSMKSARYPFQTCIQYRIVSTTTAGEYNIIIQIVKVIKTFFLSVYYKYIFCVDTKLTGGRFVVDGLTGEGCIPDPLDVVVQAVGGEAGVTNVDITSLAEIFGVLVNHVAAVVFTRLHHPAQRDGDPGRGQQEGAPRAAARGMLSKP